MKGFMHATDFSHFMLCMLLVVQFQARLEHLVRSAAAHPKMAALQEVVVRHFSDHAASADCAHPSRVIIFTNLRDSVHQICTVLRQHELLVQARCACITITVESHTTSTSTPTSADV